MTTSPTNIERNKDSFELTKLFEARKKTWDALNQISLMIQPGVTEGEAKTKAEEILTSLGSTQKWHRTWIRFGKNTIHPFGVLSDPLTRLEENDIFFIDLGPVWDGYEGDCGDTFVVGSNENFLKCKKDCLEIWKTVKTRWQETGDSGATLYQFTETLASQRGWQLNMTGSSGHRIADFPHTLYHKGSIRILDQRPSPHCWILEVQIRHPTLPFGAFYEDLLTG